MSSVLGPSPPSIQYFSEFLPRLKTISVCIKYPENVLPKALHTNEQGDMIILVDNDGKQLQLKIPVRSIPNFNVSVTGENGMLSFKLPSDPKDTQVESIERFRDIDTLTDKDSLPWSAKEMASFKAHDDSFVCLKCHRTLIPLKSVRRIDPMPSEFWSEMMEFWHCHKPATDSTNSYNSINDRFNKFHPGDYNLIVGSHYIVLNPAQFAMTTIGESCNCAGCNFQLGIKDTSTGNYKVYMWNLGHRVAGSSVISTFHPYLQAFSLLIDSISATAIRFYVVKVKQSKDDACSRSSRLLVWCFSFGLEVVIGNLLLHNSLKVMFKNSDTEIDEFVRQSKSSSVQYDTIELDKICYDDFASELLETHQLLPDQQNSFNGWDIGYIPERNS
ncbi:hypothetical protein FOA43_000362 [Brettanomyces nanus]|uniref:Ubiquitin-conjugating enzyme E2C-binding protein n=1 Tax=Eeniella nana TaxID=13502 RepID=A0A875RWX7_EENNA|nr:uncharacterized protein FOA43_000362 [Brettanomyces nanus]QPG73058.1 hypothetical protein FOA43_000362 [Brettanomyces nanus]